MSDAKQQSTSGPVASPQHPRQLKLAGQQVLTDTVVADIKKPGCHGRGSDLPSHSGAGRTTRHQRLAQINDWDRHCA